MEKKTEIIIMGNRFSIKSNLSDSQVSGIVNKVENMIKTYQKKSKQMSLQSAALISCLTLASELVEYQEKVNSYKNDSVLKLLKLKEQINGNLQQRRETQILQEHTN